MTDTIEIYTDGGNRNTGNVKGGHVNASDKAAWAAVLLFQGHEKILTGGEFGKTNNYMEINAVIQALKALKRKDLSVNVHSDSAYVINTLQQKWYVKWQQNNWKKQGKPVKNAELWAELIALIQSFSDITFTKVKGHANDRYNNLVDETLNQTMDNM